MRNERLYKLVKSAQEYYQDCLYSEKGIPAMKYLREREMSDVVIKKFGIGYAPDNDELLSYLFKKGFSEEELLLSGLVEKAENGFIKKFSNRIMIPISDVKDKTVSFCGRTLSANETVFMNMADTPIFSKKECIFGLNAAKKSQDGYVLLVEGVLDAVTFNQMGNTSVVATIDSTLSEKQAEIIKSLRKEILITYDNDEVGRKLANQAFETLRREGIVARIISRDEWLRRR